MDFGIARAIATIHRDGHPDRSRDGYRAIPLARSRPAARPSTPAATSTRPASCSTSCSPASRRSRATPRVAVAYQHVREDPCPRQTWRPTSPPDVDAVVMKMLAKNPANRYQNADRDARRPQPPLAGGGARYAAAARTLPARPPKTPEAGSGAQAAASRRAASGSCSSRLLTLLAGGAVTGGLLLSQDRAPSDTTVAVPPLTGMTLDNAKRTILAAGLRRRPDSRRRPAAPSMSTPC